MRELLKGKITCLAGMLLAILLLLPAYVRADKAVSGPVVRPSTPTTLPAQATSLPAADIPLGKQIVVLDELMEMYEAVPFEHYRHAQMAEMSEGCTTCHHHPPQATTLPATLATTRHTQDESAQIPACKSCHAIAPATADIRMPSLKGAYHRQCLNCHRDWMEANACVLCHAVKKKDAPATTRALAPDDIVGRMHKPLAPPVTREFHSRFTPVAGANVLFRHEEHAKEFGIKCATCHRRDNCANCHAAPESNATAAETTTRPQPLRPGRTWKETNGPCLSCHQADHCDHCHYQDGKTPPPAFTHQMTGQILDKDHANLPCADCHAQIKTIKGISCGASSCHKKVITWPATRPGPCTQATGTGATTREASTQPTATMPATHPTIIRIRRGGL